MILGPVFEQFVNKSPLSVMSRATIEHALSASALDELFERTAERGYTKELLFSTTVDLMSLVVCGKVPHVQSAYQQLLEDFGMTHDDVGRRVGKSRAAVTNTLRLLSLPASIQGMVERGELSAGHARALAASPSSAPTLLLPGHDCVEGP